MFNLSLPRDPRQVQSDIGDRPESREAMMDSLRPRSAAASSTFQLRPSTRLSPLPSLDVGTVLHNYQKVPKKKIYSSSGRVVKKEGDADKSKGGKGKGTGEQGKGAGKSKGKAGKGKPPAIPRNGETDPDLEDLTTHMSRWLRRPVSADSMVREGATSSGRQRTIFAKPIDNLGAETQEDKTPRGLHWDMERSVLYSQIDKYGSFAGMSRQGKLFSDLSASEHKKLMQEQDENAEKMMEEENTSVLFHRRQEKLGLPPNKRGLGHMEAVTAQADLESTRRNEKASMEHVSTCTSPERGPRPAQPEHHPMSPPSPRAPAPAPTPTPASLRQLHPSTSGRPTAGSHNFAYSLPTPVPSDTPSQEGEMARNRMFKLQQRKQAQQRTQFFQKRFAGLPPAKGKPTEKGSPVKAAREPDPSELGVGMSDEERERKDREWMRNVQARYRAFKMPNLTENEMELMSRHVHDTTLGVGGINVDYRMGYVLLDALEKNPQIDTLVMRQGTPWFESLLVVCTQLRFQSTITVLDLQECNLSWVQLEALLPLIDRRGEGWEKKKVEEMTTQLTDLNLRGNPVGDYGIALLAKAFERNEHLTKVDLSRCGFREAGASSLGKMLTENDNIEWLSIEWNYVGHNDGAKVLSEGLRFNNAVKFFDMSECGLRDNGAAYIAKALEDNIIITELDLSSNGLGEGASLVLSDSLVHNNSLQRLNLKSNPLGYEGACRLMDALKANDTLKKVDLSRCNFSTAFNEVEFDENKPSGNYKLDLSKPVDYAVAVKLVNLWHQQGPESWKTCKYNGERFELTEHRCWPQRLPERGLLEVMFVAMGKKEVECDPVTDESFQEMWEDIVTPSTTDEWRLSYVLLLAGNLYFTVAQIVKIIAKLQWTGDRIEAVTVLFGRIVNPEEMKVLQDSMRELEWEQIMQRLGEFSNFSPKNPTGHYNFSLTRVLDYTVAMRLKSEYIDQWEDGLCDGQLHCCIRNMRYDGKHMEDPRLDGLASIEGISDWEIPREGFLTLDFVSFRHAKGTERPLSQKVFKYLCDMLPHSLTLGMPTIVNSINMAVEHENECIRLRQPILHTSLSMRNHVLPKQDDGETPDNTCNIAVQELLTRMSELDDLPAPERLKVLQPYITPEVDKPEYIMSQDELTTVKEADVAEGTMLQCSILYPITVVYIVEGEGTVLGKAMEMDTQKQYMESVKVVAGNIINEHVVLFHKEEADGTFPRLKLVFHAKTFTRLLLIPAPLFAYGLAMNEGAAALLYQNLRSRWYPDFKPKSLDERQRMHMLSDMCVNVLRRVAITHHFTCHQLIEILNNSGVFDEARDRVDVVAVFYARLIDRKKHIMKVFRVMTYEEQMMCCSLLGALNFIDVKDAEMQYRLDLKKDDDLKVARMLSKLATRGGGGVNWNNLYINGEGPKKVQEDGKFWTYITGKGGLPLGPGEHPSNILEFYFDIVEDQRVVWGVMVVQAKWRAFVRRREYLKSRWYIYRCQIFVRNKIWEMWNDTLTGALKQNAARKHGQMYNVRKSVIGMVQTAKPEMSMEEMAKYKAKLDAATAAKLGEVKDELAEIQKVARNQKAQVQKNLGGKLGKKGRKSKAG